MAEKVRENNQHLGISPEDKRASAQQPQPQNDNSQPISSASSIKSTIYPTTDPNITGPLAPDYASPQWKNLEWDTPFEEFGLPGTPDDLPKSFVKLTDPFEWASEKKIMILVLSCISTLMGGYAAGAYTSGISQMMAYWHVKKLLVVVGVTTFTTGFAIGPMFLAPLSEVFGRKPMLVFAYVLFNVCHLSIALCRSFPGLLVARFWQGIGASIFSTIIAGIVSDIYHAKQRGIPMSLFAFMAMAGIGVGPTVNGFIAQYSTWRWIHWSQLIYNCVQMMVVLLAIKETRGSALLSQKAKLLNKLLEEAEAQRYCNEGKPTSMSPEKIRWKSRGDEEKATFKQLMSVSVIRPIYFLCTEPVVFWFSMWASFAWAMLYMFLQSVPLLFTNIHHFTPSQVGLIFIAVFAGAAVGFIINTLFELYGKQRLPDRGPENRLYLSCVLSPLVPVGMFWLGWTAYPDYAWILPALAVFCSTVGIFATYLAVFNYLADAYHRYASSALAAQCFCRNIVAGALPLVSQAMFHKMGFQGGSGFLGGVSLALCLVPWVLMVWGPRIRNRSVFARQLHAEAGC